MNELRDAPSPSRPRPRRPRVLPAAALLCVLAATPRPAAAAGLQDLLDGGSLDAAGTTFHDWELLSLDAGAAPDLSLVEVLPLTGDPLAPGFQVVANGQLATAGIDAIDLVFAFRVSPPPGLAVSGQALTLDGFAFGGGTGVLTVTAEITGQAGADLASALVMADNGIPFSILDDASGFAPQPDVDVVMNVFITGLDAGDTVRLDAFAQTFALVPEPGTLVLALVGAPFLAARRRRRKPPDTPAHHARQDSNLRPAD